jgi:hypothetical protein
MDRALMKVSQIVRRSSLAVFDFDPYTIFYFGMNIKIQRKLKSLVKLDGKKFTLKERFGELSGEVEDFKQQLSLRAKAIQEVT